MMNPRIASIDVFCTTYNRRVFREVCYCSTRIAHSDVLSNEDNNPKDLAIATLVEPEETLGYELVLSSLSARRRRHDLDAIACG